MLIRRKLVADCVVPEFVVPDRVIPPHHVIESRHARQGGSWVQAGGLPDGGHRTVPEEPLLGGCGPGIGSATGFGQDTVVAHCRHRVADGIKLKAPRIAMIDQGKRQRFQRQQTTAHGKTFQIGRRWANPVGHLHNGRRRRQSWQQPWQVRIIAAVPEIDGQTNRLIGEFFDKIQGPADTREKAAAGGRSGVQRSEGDCHSRSSRDRGEDFEGLDE